MLLVVAVACVAVHKGAALTQRRRALTRNGWLAGRRHGARRAGACIAYSAPSPPPKRHPISTPYLWAASSPAQPHACPRNPPTRAAAHWVTAPCDWVDGDLTQSGRGPGFNVLPSRRHSLARPCRCPVPLLRQTKHSDAECAATSTPGPFAWQTAGPEGEQREGNLSTDGRYKNKTHALARRPSLASLSRNAAAPKQSFLDHPRCIPLPCYQSVRPRPHHHHHQPASCLALPHLRPAPFLSSACCLGRSCRPWQFLALVASSAVSSLDCIPASSLFKPPPPASQSSLLPHSYGLRHGQPKFRSRQRPGRQAQWLPQGPRLPERHQEVRPSAVSCPTPLSSILYR